MLTRRTYRFLILGVIATFLLVFLQSRHSPRETLPFPLAWTNYDLSKYLYGDLNDTNIAEYAIDIIPPPPVDETKNCDRCLVSPEWCADFGSRNLDLSMAHEGSGDRLRRALAKSERGEPIKFGIIGGSLSRGHGCHCTPFHKQVFDWWNETYPHPDNLYIDGSVGARGSNYFKFCHAEHLRPDLDIVLVELSINDRFEINNAHNMESIIRSMLSYHSQPAVIMTASFSLMGGLEMGIDGHLAIAQYYDVPVISMRNALLPIIHKHPEMRKVYFAWDNPGRPDLPDILHFSGLGHAALAKTTIALIQRQACILHKGRPTMPGNSTVWPAGEDFDTTVPFQRLIDNYNADQKEMSPIDRPQCMSIDSPRQKLTPISSEGWEPWRQPNTDKQFFRATEPGKRISFEVNLGSGQVAIYYLKSNTMGLGLAKCWLNDDIQHAHTLDGWWPSKMNIGEFMVINEKRATPPGKYIVTCETLAQPMKDEGRGNTFLLIAVMTV
ncbi:hypothetical protein M422DRAFT_33956 [Sphaerobolus stellatus SS14]|uniref:SGNH hydrolase-type esterase domain-containing protein n=1 Tax=Sphaerobolus stellatus (strain SS14) TaxID=990650 RepID=A0A0C9V681_SPHS4|nr:hypothetical protein M422DRAFT_33956 [Sphaerobolus stellatus SS14]